MVAGSVRVSVKVARLVKMDNWRFVWVTGPELVNGLPINSTRSMLTGVSSGHQVRCSDCNICKARLGYCGMKRGCDRGDCDQAQHHALFDVWLADTGSRVDRSGFNLGGCDLTRGLTKCETTYALRTYSCNLA